MKLIDLIRISRPKFWLYLAGTYFVGLVFAIENPIQLLTPFFILNFLFFLIPANFLLYGINDYFDFDTDQYNDKKDSHEHRLKLKEKNLLVGYLLLCAALSFFITALQTQIEVQLLFTLFLLLSVLTKSAVGNPNYLRYHPKDVFLRNSADKFNVFKLNMNIKPSHLIKD